MKRDRFVLGLVLGLVFPALAFALIYIFWFYDGMSFSQYVTYLGIHRATFAGVLSLSLIFNLPIFFMNIWSHRYFAARGVIMATFIYGIVIIYLKAF